MNQKLFASEKDDVGTKDLKTALEKVGARDCDVLYAHTGMTFGLPALKRKELLGELFRVFEDLNVATVVFPTFTFSFCNNEAFDPDKTPTPMGALNEYARKTGRGRRSIDPILSVYVIGEDPGLIDNLGEYSLGKNSGYDKLHNCGRDVKFLFFGTDMRDCFTYTHYVEAIKEVPYRYNRKFSGKIIENGVERDASVYLYSTYSNCVLNPVPVVHDEMEKRGMLNKTSVGDGSLCCFSEKDGYNVLAELIDANPCALTDGNFNPNILDFNYNPSGGRVVSAL